jgi:hypothetical protein
MLREKCCGGVRVSAGSGPSFFFHKTRILPGEIWTLLLPFGETGENKKISRQNS